MGLLQDIDYAAWRRYPASMCAATFFGVGHLPGGPGTYAAIAFLPVAWCLSMAIPDPMLRIGAVVAATVASVVWCERAGEALGEEDSRKIVLDEVIGVWVTLAPFTALGWLEVAVGCLAFRLLDIYKPWPIRAFEARVHGGLGVVFDDVLAGVLAIPAVLLVRMFIG